ncbi:cell division protein ZapA [Ciceribacter sp. L1K22]|uniref:cell division protein ZapA n=1 Tax=Ciceribacter sp. L1K22 TaxID=2820275 RepID=UPI001ABE93A6|nr:cell division protein ZapA [Ciceribacter sp. L1K22]MBO3761898.1 cell division protein ZapA [Ciceribacter sp. L1K22]
MAQVTVTIDGKAYRMACEEGQEDHLIALSSTFDRYVGHLKTQFGEIGDLRLTVMAGIMVMDELSELNKRVASLESELTALRSGRDEVLAGAEKREELLLSSVVELTEKLTGITRKLTGRADPVASTPGE